MPYGGPDKNPFPIPGISTEQYYVIYNEVTKVAQVFRTDRFGDKSLGTYNLETKQYTPFQDQVNIAENSNNLLSVLANTEIEYLTSLKGKEALRTAITNTTRAGIDAAATADGQQLSPEELKAKTRQALGDTYTASDTEEPTPNFEGQGKAETLESKSNLKLDGGKYPLDIDNAGIDYVYFQAARLEINSGLVGSNSNLSTILADRDSRREFTAVEGGPVIIGAQAPIRGQNRVGWREGQLNAFEAAFYNTAYHMIGGKDPLSNDVKQVFDELKSNRPAFEELIKRAAAAQAVSNPSIFSRSSALILNPNIELLFNKPELRTFPFQFMLTAREGIENIQIKNIIRYFKYHMAPKVVETNLFLKTPHVFFIEYVKAGSEGNAHQGLNLIAPQIKGKKACALVSFDVDYTPLGRYMTFEDGDNMVAYTLSLVFQDINPVYDIDYDDPHPIGY